MPTKLTPFSEQDYLLTIEDLWAWLAVTVEERDAATLVADLEIALKAARRIGGK